MHDISRARDIGFLESLSIGFVPRCSNIQTSEALQMPIV
jgi:hypothetical protein